MVKKQNKRNFFQFWLQSFSIMIFGVSIDTKNSLKIESVKIPILNHNYNTSIVKEHKTKPFQTCVGTA